MPLQLDFTGIHLRPLMVSSLGIKWLTMDTEQLFKLRRYSYYAVKAEKSIYMGPYNVTVHFLIVYKLDTYKSIYLICFIHKLMLPGQARVSPTIAGLHCACACVSGSVAVLLLQVTKPWVCIFTKKLNWQHAGAELASSPRGAPGRARILLHVLNLIWQFQPVPPNCQI